MKRHQRRHGALRRLGQACERLEPRQFLSGDGAGIQLLPAQFDPADYASMGPQLAASEAMSAPATAAASTADAQARFASAEEFENYLLDVAVKRYEYALGKTFDYHPFWRWNWEYVTLYNDFSSSTPRTDSYTTTNVQEAGVDEADLVETDGKYIYLVQDEELLIFDANAVEHPRLLSRTKIDGMASGIYLDGDRVTVISQDASPIVYGDLLLRDSIWPGPGTQRGSIKVTVLDVADRSMPKLVSQTELDGYLVSSRKVEGRVYLTINSNLDVPQPVATQITEAGVTRWQVETAEAYRARIRPLLQDTLPHYQVNTVGNEGARQPLSDPTDIYKSAGLDDTFLTSVVVIDSRAAKPAPIGSASVLGTSGQLVYASEDNLYVLSTRWLQEANGQGTTKTEIRKFHFTSTGIELAATGEVDGTVLNQFSLSEHAGYLRVATTENWGATAKNHLFVLSEQGEELTVVGALRDLAPGERIFSSRLMGNRGFIVTFRQVDPLFTLDLSDPTNPKVLGELKLPGFSNYLQVLDENTVLGIGRDADPVTGQQSVLMITIFDVSNLAQPRVKDQFKFESNYWSSADYDHHQVLYDPEYHTLAIPVSGSVLSTGASLSQSELWVFDVSPSLGIELRGRVAQGGQVLRSLRIEDVLFSISTESLVAAPVLQPGSKLAEVVYNRDFVGLQIDPLLPEKFNVVLWGGQSPGRFEVAVEGSRLQVTRNGQLIGDYDQAAIGGVVASSISGSDRLLVKNRRAISGKIETSGWGMAIDMGDVDGDGLVGLSDFGLLKSQMGQRGENLAGDVDRDGDVDLDDAGIVRANFGLPTERSWGPIVIMPFGGAGLLRPAMNAVAIDLVLATNESSDDIS